MKDLYKEEEEEGKQYLKAPKLSRNIKKNNNHKPNSS
jgi:hypothetical protein